MIKKGTETLDAAFRRRFRALSKAAEDNGNDPNNGTLGFTSRDKRLTLRKETIKAIENRMFGTIDRRAYPG